MKHTQPITYQTERATVPGKNLWSLTRTQVPSSLPVSSPETQTKPLKER